MPCLLALAVVWIATPPPGLLPTGVVEHEGRLLAGTDLGLFAAGPAGWERTPVTGGVLDLIALPGRLWVASAHGLWLWERGAEPRFVALGAGARLRAVAADSRGGVWVSTESGLFSSPAGASLFERDASLPPGDAAAVRAAGDDLVVARAGTLWIRRGERFEPLASGLGDGWWELRAAAHWRGALYLAVPRGLWRITERTEGSRALPGQEAMERIDPGLGELRDLHVDGSGLWVASARGLWRFTEPPAPAGGLAQALLEASTSRLHAAGERVLAATDRGLAAVFGESGAALPPSARLPSRALEEPDVREVHAAVLAYLDLAPQAMREAEQRSRRRGWLPELRASVHADRDRSREHDRDEVLSSGSVWRLYDANDEADRGWGADLVAIWDLGQLASPDDAIALSRERRLVIELRDQVLERVNRLYFERQRAREALAAGGEPVRRRELELRVAELTAQLDAWTGGRFSRLLGDSPRSNGR